MAELKRNFLKSKMNKDLDERLVPNGEYRDALNIEITSSDSSQVGSVQTLSGNVKWQGYETEHNQSLAQTVGKYVDEENNAIYNFVANDTFTKKEIVQFSGGQKNVELGVKSDAIFQITPHPTNSSDTVTKLVMRDVYEVRLKPNEVSAGRTIAGFKGVINQYQDVDYNGQALNPLGLRVGMRVQAIDPAGVDLYGADNKVYITKIQSYGVSPTDFIITTNKVYDIEGLYTESMMSAGVVLKFTAPRILKFKTGDTRELEANTTYPATTSTPTNSYISAINVIDDLLLWTDGRNEPKKINIKRSIAGSANPIDGSMDSLFPCHTLLAVEIKNKLYLRDNVRESHITVIRPNPDLAPRAISLAAGGSDIESTLVWEKQFGSNAGPQEFGPWAFSNNNNQLYSTTTDIYIQPQVQTGILWAVGDIIALTGEESATTVNVEVTEVNNSGGEVPGPNNSSYYTVRRVDDFNDESEDGVEYNADQPDENWFAIRVAKDQLYAKDFIRFAYRYKYTDGEYSAISPFSPACFLAGDYAYSAKDGYNLGMLNRTQQIKVSDFWHEHTPRDVVEIELIFKSQKSDNMHIWKNVSAYDGNQSIGAFGQHFDLNGVFFINVSPTNVGFENSSFTITERLFGFTLPSDQQTRVFDAVPRKAVAQEIQANRLMYGNHTQDYDLVDGFNALVQPDVTALVKNNFYSDFLTSFESSNVATAYTNYRDFVATNATTVSLEDILSGDATFNYGPNHYNTQDIDVLPHNGVQTSLAIQMSGEHDPGDNFSQSSGLNGVHEGSSLYYAPKSGYYTVEATARVVAKISSGGGDITRRKTRLAILPVVSDSGSSAGAAYPYSNWQVGPAEDGTLLPGNGNSALGAWRSQASISEEGYNIASFITNYFNGAEWVTQWDPGDNHETWTLTIPPTQIYLQEANVFEGASYGNIGLFVQTDNETPGSNDDVIIADVQFKVTEAPVSTVDGISSLRGQRSIKSERNYNLGIVYRDEYGRESSVLIDETNDFKLEKTYAQRHTSLYARAENMAPTWATTYKFFIKENTSKYQNLVLEAAFSSQSANYIYLVFNSADKDKVKSGDYLVGKKRHNTNSYVSDPNAKWRVISVIANINSEDGTVGGDPVPVDINASQDELDGKFLVKVRNIELTGPQNILGSFSSVDPLNGDEQVEATSFDSNNGAVFEVEPETTVDLDLYYEISDSYAIRLDADNATRHIRKGMKVCIPTQTGVNVPPACNLKFHSSLNPSVVKVVGSKTDSPAASNTFDTDYLCEVTLDASVTHSLYLVNKRIRFYDPEFGNKNMRAYVECIVTGVGAITANSSKIYVRPEVHKVPGWPYATYVGLGWYNCFSFGNGVESDTIRDDFNGEELLKYVAAGKQSGFKASMPVENYEEHQVTNEIIFSEIYNEKYGLNRLNEFLVVNNIKKQVNRDYGSIQKLFSRNSDLLALCEKKCLKILSQKDALFNADGNAQLLTTDKVLGQAIPFAGDYGISKNPESFAADEYRCYFTDKQRSAVIRLSMDGITPISDAGMKDWFRDQMLKTEAIIGSFDGNKNEYNITLHEVTSRNYSKNVYTLSFNEDIDGWASFKSFIKEAGLTLNNKYYTFKNSKLYNHSQQIEYKNVFYSKQYDSSITTLFNDSVSDVKTFRTISYEGTQAKVEVSTYNDGEYFNLGSKSGWYVEYINTDLQDAKAKGFKDKEGKWFSYLKGNPTIHTNIADGGTASTSNIDMSEFSVQGLGKMTSGVTLISGTLPGEGFDVTLDPDFGYSSESSDETI